MKHLLLTELTVVRNMLFLLAVHSLMVELTANVAKAWEKHLCKCIANFEKPNVIIVKISFQIVELTL